MTLIVTVLGIIYALDVPAVLKVVEPAARTTVQKAGLRTGLMALTYFVLYLALGVWTWRRLRATRGARR